MYVNKNDTQYFSIGRKFIYVVLLVCLSGCMPPLLPIPTTNPVEHADIAGVWALDNEAIVELNKDKTFQISGTHSLDGIGSWRISEDSKQSIYVSYEGQGVKIDIIGYVIETKSDEFAIFGGVIRDPDAWHILKRVVPR